MIEHFRKWYDYERDCNSKAMAMLASVPAEKRDSPDYIKALGKMSHCIVARQMWLFRLGHGETPAGRFPNPKSLDELTAPLAAVEAAWVAYFAKLNEAELKREFDYTGWDNKPYRWNVEGLLTQTNGHAWYHRGQIAMLVAALGGQAVDTDFVLWPGAGRVAL